MKIIISRVSQFLLIKGSLLVKQQILLIISHVLTVYVLSIDDILKNIVFENDLLGTVMALIDDINFIPKNQKN